MPGMSVTVSTEVFLKLVDKAKKDKKGNVSATVNQILADYFTKKKGR